MRVLINKLLNKNIYISHDNDNLKIRYNEDIIPEEILEEIRRNKKELLIFLKEYDSFSYNDIKNTVHGLYYKLSSAQKRLWILSQFEEESVAYNSPSHIELNGDYDIEIFKQAINCTIERHESLRTVFKADDSGEIRQWVLPKDKSGFAIDCLDFREEENKEGRVRAYIEEDSYKLFDLEQGPLLRAALLQVLDDQYIFYYNIHHIISDGWSMEVLAKDVFSYYEAYKEGKEPNLPELRIQYKDYAAWQIQQLEEDSFRLHRDYWLAQLGGELPVLELPTSKKRPVVKTNRGGSLEVYLSKEVSIKLKDYAQQNGGTLFMGLLASIKAMFYRYTGLEDIIIGSPIAGREHVDLENQIGFYINTLVLRNKVHGSDSFDDLYARIKQTTLDAYTHQKYPFDHLVEELDLKRDPSRSAIFDVMVVLQNNGEKNKGVVLNNDLIESIKGNQTKTSKFDLLFAIEELGDCLSFIVEYNTDVYDGELIERFIRHYKAMLFKLLEQSSQPIGSIDYLSGEEKEKLLFAFNDTRVNYKELTVMELFEEQVAKTPEAVALVFEDKELTYRQLNEQSNQLGAYLRVNYNIQPNDLVGIKMERSEKFIISVLGVLKSGGAYVPIDPNYPQERIAYIETDSNIKITIDNQEIERFSDIKENYSQDNLTPRVNGDNLVYIIYTSGSTGTPKGILMQHKSMFNLVAFHNNQIEEGVEKVLQFTSISFDVSFQEMFTTLTRGAAIYPISESDKSDPGELVAFIEKNIIDTIFLPTSYFKILVETKDFNDLLRRCNLIKNIIVAGEQLVLSNEAIKIIQESKIKLHNHYGPAETHVVTAVTLEGNYLKNNPSIGRPISNTQIYILNDSLQPVPTGVSGKLYISGTGVARGYLNKPELTNEKFVPNPFIAGTIMYDTGDLGRWMPDGSIEFLGRKDHQVKIRGYRIELGEIESTVLQYSQELKQVLVEAREVNGEKSLVAYLVSQDSTDKSDLHSFLKGKLPEYMVPSYYVDLERLPLTANGKIDRKALPNVAGEDLIRNEYVAPRNVVEQELVSIWQEVLGVDKIGVTDNFFELGGNSLNVIKIWSKINALKKYNIKYNEIYSFPTIHELLKTKENESRLIKFSSYEQKKNATVYFIPPIIGISSIFGNLAKMLEFKMNCYAFDYSGINDDKPFFKSIEEASEIFSEEIIKRHVDDDSNLIIFGYSMGGNIAFEMIKTLEKKYKNIKLVLVDSYVRTSKNENINEPLDKIRTYIQENKITFGENLETLILNNYNIFNNYTQKGKINSEVCLFKSEKSTQNITEWEKHIAHSLIIKTISGNHWEALSENNNKIFAEILLNQKLKNK